MKLVTEYLERAVLFERMATETGDPNLRAALEKQALAYHQLAAKRAEELGISVPQRPQDSNPN